MRGKVENRQAKNPKFRITPAHAGKSPVSGERVFIVSDHPRACGEKLHVGRVGMRLLGSPPRMRGKGESPRADGGQIRITPAHAGKS